MDRLPETDTIHSAVNAALELAAGGAPKLGYRVLDLTLARWERRPEGVAPEMLDRLRMALVLYARAHGIWFNLPSNADDLTPPAPTEKAVGERRNLRLELQECRQRAAATRQQSSETAGRSRERRADWQDSASRRRVVLLVRGDPRSLNGQPPSQE